MYTIGQFSKKSGLPASTLRYYEELDLISPQRDTGGRRQYDEADLAWVAFIVRLKATGMPLAQIQHYAALRSQGNATLEGRLEMLEIHRRKLQRDMLVLKDHMDKLDNKIDQYKQKIQALR